MPATPVLALPYPAATDTADVPRDIQALAVKLDGYTSLRPALVSSLPGSPADGQEVYYLADAANGIVWHLRYRTAATGSYKWEVLGQPPPLTAEQPADAGTASVGWVAITPTAAVTPPLAGVYDFTLGGTMWNGTAGQASLMGFQAGAAAVNEPGDTIQVVAAGANQFVSLWRSDMRRTVTVAGTGYGTAGRVSGGASGIRNRHISARPVRVG